MNNRDNNLLHAPINAKLAEIAAESITIPTWHEAWLQLCPRSTAQERLRVYQQIRDAGSLPDEAGFYLVSWQIDAMTSEHAEEALRPLDEQMDAIKEAHGLGPLDTFEPEEEPPEYQQVWAAYESAWDQLYAQKLAEYGELEMAQLFASDTDEFDRLSDEGRRYFHEAAIPGGIRCPAWLDSLLADVETAVEVESPMGPLGYAWREEEGLWEVIVYPTPVELVGGAVDGAVVTPGFSLDLKQLRSAFDEVTSLGWNALGWFDGDGPFVWVEGVYEGHEVYLRVLAQAPEDQEPGMKLDTTWLKP